MTMTPISPREAKRLIESGAALVDIRGPDEFARESIPGARNVPVTDIDRMETSGTPVVYHCRSGARTQANAARLSAAAAEARAGEILTEIGDDFRRFSTICR